MTDTSKFEMFCIVEIMGHVQIAGKVSEQAIAGQGFLRIDVPKTSKRDGFTRFYGPGAIYSMTPVDEKIAALMAERLEVEAVSEWTLRQAVRDLLPATASDDNDAYDGTADYVNDYGDEDGGDDAPFFGDLPDDVVDDLASLFDDDLPDESDPGTSGRPSPAMMESAADNQVIPAVPISVLDGLVPEAEELIANEDVTDQIEGWHDDDDESEGVLDSATERFEKAIEDEHSGDKSAAAQWARDLLKGEFVIFDTETTGFEPDDQIIQIGIINQAGDVVLERLIKPTKPVPNAIYHGITDEMLANAPGFAEVHGQIAIALLGKTVVAYNLAYDNRMLEQDCRRHNQGVISFVKSHCAMEMYAQFNGEWNDYHGNYRWKKLREALAAFGLKHEDFGKAEHDACTDARATLALIQKMAAFEAEKSVATE